MRTYEQPKIPSLPFAVAGPDSHPIAGFDVQGEADADCAERNERAAKMGLTARYAVKSQ